MVQSTSKQKISALVFLVVFSVQTFWPGVSWALTSGPTTPEMSAFEPASTANMVDMFSGDFSYNVPLLDVGGYPVNLAYHSGAGPEEEASWVGQGWSLNPGAINRQLRGLPDDFDGDELTQVDNKKPNVTVGGNVNVSLKIFGRRLPKIKFGRKKKSLSGSVKVKIGIQHNNYTGYKGMVGIGTGFGTSDDNSDMKTGQLGPASSTDLSAGLGLNVDNQAGVNPYANFEINFKTNTKKEREAERDYLQASREHSAKTMFNSWCKSQVFDVEQSASKVAKMGAILNHESHSGASVGASSAINFTGFQPPAAVQTPMDSKNFTASLSLGITLFGFTGSLGLEGTYSKQELRNKTNTAAAYGFMNSHKAKSKEDAVLDYNMEKESPYFKRLPNLGVPVFTPDLFSVTSNAGSMQFRPYLRGAGIFFQPHKYEANKSIDIGLEPAFGNLFHLGVPLQLQKTNSISGKWTTRNDYMDIGDFKMTDASNPANQAVYFKRVGEKNSQDAGYFNTIGNTSPVAVRLSNGPSAWAFGNGKAENQMRRKGGGDINANQARGQRDKANHSIAYLTAAEAAMYALEKEIPNYRENTLVNSASAIKNRINRTSAYRKPHHISQYTVTQNDGQRMVYGNPVYNSKQEEVSFAIAHNATQLTNGIAIYNPGSDNSENNQRGKDNYFHKASTPAYTTGHLLTGILSPDYVDVKNDGITDDDMGTAVKFNYSQLSDGSGAPIYYKWRTPYSTQNGNNNTANYNSGYKSITDDDKGNYTWGEKELWYMHSIESKTMVAQFYTEDREDGLGVLGENGGKNTSVRLKRLKEIRLYSKSDLYANGVNAVPIKVVHLEYYPGDPILNAMPNHVNGKGKLALKRVWFSYGNNLKGQFNSYNFKYNIPASQNYEDNQSDRWGNYKPKSANPNGLDNIEFPYATQNKIDADNFASYWQLNEIELPSGAIINIQYEADQYAYVQDKRAAQMCFVTGIGSNGASTGFATADKIFVRLPVPANAPGDLDRYFAGLKSLAYKVNVDLNGKGNYEYVSGYAKIQGYALANPGSGNDIAMITVEKVNGKYHPVAKAAWQKLKLDLPRFAFPEYDNIDAEQSGFITAIKALGAAFGRFKDLVESFDKRAIRKGFGNIANLNKSWVRLNTPVGINNGAVKGKLGGGHRVKEIRITDQWSTMSGVANAENGTYGQSYDYTTQVSGPGGAAETISSGVASYEPMMGGDENPFHEPINYVDKHLFSMPKYFYLERPMGESYFPGASVGYSKVTVKNLGADGSVGENGSTVSEFYTAKDFPTKVDELPMERRQPKLSFLPRLFGAKITSAVTVSQGYVVENNDMHGKQKGEAVYGKNGNEISSGRYYYKVSNPGAEKQDLVNQIPVAYKNGSTFTETVGMDIDMFTEMNQSTMENIGIAIDPSFGVALYGIIPKFSFRLPLPKPNYEKRIYRGSTTVKLVNRYAIMDKVVKTVNGSTSTSENLLWDAETGEVLLSKSNNEFDESIYTFNYPAHWVYDGMGSAFRNEGVYLTGFGTGANGQISTFTSLLVPGDELVNVNTAQRLWVIRTNNVLRVIDKDGKYPATALSGQTIKIMRSGRRNLAAASVGSVISMNNPMAGGNVAFSHALKILQAKAVEYNQDWPLPVADVLTTGIPYTPQDCTGDVLRATPGAAGGPGDTVTTMKKTKNGYELVREVNAQRTTNAAIPAPTSCICTCLKALFDYLIKTQQLFITQGQGITVGQLVAQANAQGYNVGTCSVLTDNADKPFYALTTSTTGTVYRAQVGDCVISIRSTTQEPVSFYSLVSQACGSSPVVSYGGGGTQTIVKTFTTTCAATNRWWPPSLLINPSPKIRAGIKAVNGVQEFFYDSEFHIPGLSTIPATAVINYANLYLYAHPQGFDPPTYPIPHTTTAQNGGNLPFYILRMATPYDCVNYVNGWVSPQTTLNITSPTQDVVVDLVPQVNAIKSSQVNNGFGFKCSQYSSTQTAYATFASENYADTSKRPKLVVSYTVSAPSTTIATLQVDQCIRNSCTPPVVNPYVTGLLGNWRVRKEWLYDTRRINNKGNAADPTGTHLRNSGYFETFAPYWQYNTSMWIAVNNPLPGKTVAPWQWSSQANKYNRKGQEIENMDALERYSSAQHGYLESVPVAVASNARHREIGFDGFEDYNFNLGVPAFALDSCSIQDHFSFRGSLGTAATLDNTKSHSGKHSLRLNGTAVITKPMLATEPASVYGFTGDYRYQVTNNFMRHGFMPIPSPSLAAPRQYVLSGWVNDGQPKSATINGLTLKIAGTTYNVNDNAANPAVYSKIHVVEGWKRFEVVFNMPVSGKFSLSLGGTNINVDDIRVHPYDAQMKSFVYDPSSMRLMADLDENNFTTFYEYDDEGTLIRVKKETEKGISTIKETRSSIRKK